MRTAFLLAALMATAAVVAGCSGGSDGSVLDECVGEACEPESGGTLLGHVLDDSSLGIAGATVGLTEAGLETQTGDNGGFQFTGLEPGKYTLHVNKLGFEAAGRSVEVADGQTTEIQVILEPIAVVEAFQDVIGPMDGFFSCGVGTPTNIRMCASVAPSAFPDDKLRLTFEMSAEHWESVVGEMRWTQGTFATSSHLANYMSYEGREDDHWWCAADGTSPIVFRYENSGTSMCSDQGAESPGPTDEGVETLFIAADTGFGGLSAENPPVRVALQQRFSLMVSIFYGEPAPSDWTAFPDA